MAVTVSLVGTPTAGAKVKAALPLASVFTLLVPMKVFPSLVPESLENKRTTKVLLGVLMRLPLMVVAPVEEVVAKLMAGLFCRLLGPVSASPGSLAVGPSLPRTLVPEASVPI